MTRRLQSVRIDNIKGIGSLAFETGSVTVIKGKNGAGKSSAVDALVSVFEGGHDPGLIRKGAKEGSIVLQLDDGVTIKKTITPKRSELEVRTADKGKVGSEATYVKKLASGLRFNPALFITMTGKERAAELSKVMPVSFAGREVNAAANESILADSEVIDLKRFSEIREGRYASRTDVGREQDTAEGFIVETERNLPTGTPASWQAVVEMLRIQVGEAKAVARDEIALLEANYALSLASLNAALNEEKARLTQAAADSTQDLTAELAKAEQSLAAQNRVEGQRQQLDKMRLTAQGLQKKWAQLDAAVKGLDRLKAEKLSTLPVPGIEVRVDEKGMPEVYVEGIAWPHVNKSMQAKIAITIAAQAIGDLPLMVLDESEVLDEDSLDLLIDAAKNLGLQIIMARVETGSELQVVKA